MAGQQYFASHSRSKSERRAVNAPGAPVAARHSAPDGPRPASGRILGSGRPLPGPGAALRRGVPPGVPDLAGRLGLAAGRASRQPRGAGGRGARARSSRSRCSMSRAQAAGRGRGRGPGRHGRGPHRQPRTLRAPRRGGLVAGPAVDPWRPDRRAAPPPRPPACSEPTHRRAGQPVVRAAHRAARARVLAAARRHRRPAADLLSLDIGGLDLGHGRGRVAAAQPGTWIGWTAASTTDLLRWLVAGRPEGPVFVTDRRRRAYRPG